MADFQDIVNELKKTNQKLDSIGKASDPKEITITVNVEENNPPVSNAGDDDSHIILHDCDPGYPDITIDLDGRDSEDPDVHYITGQNDPITYQWLLDGEEVSTDAEYSYSQNEGTVCHTLIVTDSYLLSSNADQICHTVSLQENQKPIAVVDAKVNDIVEVEIDEEPTPDGIEFELTIPHDAVSSTNSIEGSLINSRPILSRFLCPPLIFIPFSPIISFLISICSKDFGSIKK